MRNINRHPAQAGLKKPLETVLQAKLRRKINKRSSTSISALALFGAVGWNLVIPAFGGALLGQYVDKATSTHYFTFPLISLGILVGAINAWRFIDKQNRRIK